MRKICDYWKNMQNMRLTLKYAKYAKTNRSQKTPNTMIRIHI